MKKLFYTSLFSILLLSCAKSRSGKEIADEICDCSKKANALPATDPGRSSAQNDCLVKQREAWEKLKDNTDKAKEFNDGLARCADEQIKESFGK